MKCKECGRGTLAELKKALAEEDERLAAIRKIWPEYAQLPTPEKGKVNLYIHGKIDVKYSDGTWEKNLMAYTDVDSFAIWSYDIENHIIKHQQKRIEELEKEIRVANENMLNKRPESL